MPSFISSFQPPLCRFTDEEAESQKGPVTHPRPHSQGVAEGRDPKLTCLWDLLADGKVRVWNTKPPWGAGCFWGRTGLGGGGGTCPLQGQMAGQSWRGGLACISFVQPGSEKHGIGPKPQRSLRLSRARVLTSPSLG